MALTFQRRQVSDANEVMTELDRVVQQIDFGVAEGRLLLRVALVSGLNRIRHGLPRDKGAPKACFCQPRTGAMPTATQDPDGTFVYLTAAGAQVVDIMVVL